MPLVFSVLLFHVAFLMPQFTVLRFLSLLHFCDQSSSLSHFLSLIFSVPNHLVGDLLRHCRVFLLCIASCWRQNNGEQKLWRPSPLIVGWQSVRSVFKFYWRLIRSPVLRPSFGIVRVCMRRRIHVHRLASSPTWSHPGSAVHFRHESPAVVCYSNNTYGSPKKLVGLVSGHMQRAIGLSSNLHRVFDISSV